MNGFLIPVLSENIPQIGVAITVINEGMDDNSQIRNIEAPSE